MSGRWRFGSGLTLAVTLALFVAHVWASQGSVGPSVVFDEAGYLGNARWLAGGTRWDMPRSPAYAIGYPLLLAPIMKAFASPDAQWHAILVLNAALLAAVFPLLVTVLRRIVGVSPPVAFGGALVGAVTPAVVADGISAISENLVMPLVLLSVLSVWWTTPSGRTRLPATRYVLGPVVAFLVFSHPRFTMAAPIVVIALVVGTWKRAIPGKTAAVNTVSLTALVIAGRWLTAEVVTARWDAIHRPEGGPGDWLQLTKSLSGWRELALGAVGQSWYLVAGSLGLSVIGVVVVGQIVFDRPGVGVPPNATRSLRRDRRYTFGLVAAMAAVVFVTSVLFFARNQFRADHWIYGRHNDSFTPLWVALGVAGLAEGSLRWRRYSIGLAALVVGSTGWLLATFRHPAELDNRFSPFAVPAIMRWVAPDPEVVFRTGTWSALAGIAMLAIVAILPTSVFPRWFGDPRRSIAVLVLVLATGAWFAYVGFGTVQGTKKFAVLTIGDWPAPGSVQRLGIGELDIAEHAIRGRPTMAYPFFLPGVTVRTYDGARGEKPSGPYSVAPLDDPARVEAGDRVLMLDSKAYYAAWGSPLGLAIWVAPGPAQDRYEASGQLLPAAFPTTLPETARHARINIEGGGGRIRRIGAGDATTVVARVHHTGTGSPWPDWRAFPRTGRVLVRALAMRADTPNGPALVVGVGELPAWMEPGDTTRVEVNMVALESTNQPLSPGRYKVRLVVAQEGSDWWTAPSGTNDWFWLDVAR